jgi:hypothetical protein
MEITRTAIDKWLKGKEYLQRICAFLCVILRTLAHCICSILIQLFVDVRANLICVDLVMNQTEKAFSLSRLNSLCCTKNASGRAHLILICSWIVVEKIPIWQSSNKVGKKILKTCKYFNDHAICWKWYLYFINSWFYNSKVYQRKKNIEYCILPGKDRSKFHMVIIIGLWVVELIELIS